MNQFSLRVPQKKDWRDIATLVGISIPNYIVSKLGPRFGAIYYRHLTDHPDTCTLAAYDDSGTLAGVVIGTLDRKTARRLTLPVVVKLLLAANFRLLSPAFCVWLTQGVRSAMLGMRTPKQIHNAEMVIFAVSPAFRGERLAPRLMDALEEFFRLHQLRTPYLILTEKANLAGNRFYEKIGAYLVRTYLHHGRQINEWHKSLTSPVASREMKTTLVGRNG